MLSVSVQNLDNPLASALRVKWCASFFCRLRGLMFHLPLEIGEGLLLVQERESRADSAIHMFFMRMDLAIVWIDQDCEVVDVRVAKRWRSVIVPTKAAKYVLEISAQRFSEFQIGDRLRFEESNLD